MSRIRHGTLTGYNCGCRCGACRDARAGYQHAWRTSHTASDALRHGDVSTYNNYGCRCAACTEARRDYDAGRYAAAKAATP